MDKYPGIYVNYMDFINNSRTISTKQNKYFFDKEEERDLVFKLLEEGKQPIFGIFVVKYGKIDL